MSRVSGPLSSEILPFLKVCSGIYHYIFLPHTHFFEAFNQTSQQIRYVDELMNSQLAYKGMTSTHENTLIFGLKVGLFYYQHDFRKEEIEYYLWIFGLERKFESQIYSISSAMIEKNSDKIENGFRNMVMKRLLSEEKNRIRKETWGF